MKKTTRVLALVLCLVALFSFVSCQKEEELVEDESGALFVSSKEETNFVCIEMNTGKKIVVELYPEVAPITVENFKKLVGENFYDGLIFHRVISGFMIQGGCPEGTGMGGPGYEIKGEFASNGWNNTLPHQRGVLSMARSQAPDSAGSQFFICHSTAGCSHLDGQYATFGKVVSGMDVVDEIATTPCNGETPVKDQVMKKVYFVDKAEAETATAE